ncbi:2Fe-2S iron-sulfur cluster-binding protein [Prescottella defluvii]|nr:2Fe-2S iron-sulfur cluster-binding protein [Prescottella defluvii]
MSDTGTFSVSVGTDTVDCALDQSLLDAFLRAGVWMPNSCNQGTCGTCKLQVVSGSVDHRSSPESTLSRDERAGGLALACQATPCTDTVVERRESAPVDHTHVLRDLVGSVTAIDDVARETRRVTVMLDSPLEFSAGQYVELHVPGTDQRRQYSMANTPGEAKVLEFHIRRERGGLATDNWVFNTMSIGDQVNLTGPLGDFRLDIDGREPMILLGGGTGLAPLKSIARSALDLDPAREIHLYHGVRARADLYDAELFHEWERAHPNFRYLPCLSDEQWDGRTGYVSDVLASDFSSCRGYSGYLCGPPPMVDAGVKAFKRRRMAPRRIFREKFTAATYPTPSLTNA